MDLGYRLIILDDPSSAQNQSLTQHFAGVLADQNLIAEVSETQMYSHTDGRYLPDRYIEGTCPNCGFDSARGDQCDNCTKQLDPVDLINPHSTISGSTDLEMRETKHLYLRQVTNERSARGLDRQQNGLARPNHLYREKMVERWGWPTGSGDYP
jgi:methionyl-tRNA synthetase